MKDGGKGLRPSLFYDDSFDDKGKRSRPGGEIINNRSCGELSWSRVVPIRELVDAGEGLRPSLLADDSADDEGKR